MPCGHQDSRKASAATVADGRRLPLDDSGQVEREGQTPAAAVAIWLSIASRLNRNAAADTRVHGKCRLAGGWPETRVGVNFRPTRKKIGLKRSLPLSNNAHEPTPQTDWKIRRWLDQHSPATTM